MSVITHRAASGVPRRWQVDHPGAIGAERVRHDLAAFVLLGYAITWSIWLPLLFEPSRAAAESPWRPLFYLGYAGPLIAALLVGARYDGRRGVAALGRGLVPRRRQLRWLALGIVTPLVLWSIAVLVSRFVFGLVRPPLFLLGAWVDLPRFTALAGWMFILATAGVGAEVGWRGFALPHLQSRHGAIESTLLVTLMWAGWHVPLFSFDPTYRELALRGLAVWLLALLGASAVLTWLFNRSRGSTLACALFHGVTTSIWMSWAVAEPIGWGIGALVVVAGIVASARIGRLPLVRWEAMTRLRRPTALAAR